MGEQSDLQRLIKFNKNHHKDYEERLLKIIYVIKMPVVWIKVNKYTKTYYLLNFIPILSVTKY